MTEVERILSQVEILEDGNIRSKSTGNVYRASEFIENCRKRLKLTSKQTRELESGLSNTLRPQSDNAEYVQKMIDKYKFWFSDGVYSINGVIITLPDIYRLMWETEKLLPSEVLPIIENIEKISPELDLQQALYKTIIAKAIPNKKSKYLESLDKLYPEIDFRAILYNILTPKSKPLFHIFYDDGVGGTGKSTLLEVITKIVGEDNVSNVLLDQFANRFVFANMLGKYVNIGDDNGKNEELANIGTLKSIVTGNRITIDRKNISPVEVRIFAKQLFATNILPYIDFTDGGIMRRLNIVKMNKVIPKNSVMPIIDSQEIGAIVGEVIAYGKDIESNNNELAITTSPIYRFYNQNPTGTYNDYCSFCAQNGFRCMNIINFEVKTRFIRAHCNTKNIRELLQGKKKEIKQEELEF